MKIIYFHGFASSGASGTVECLRKLMPECEILAPDIPVDPAEALPFLKEFVAEQQPDLIIGTSMGGMYAQQMYGYPKICVNPALNMSKMSKLLRTGTYRFLNGRKDNQKEFRITRDIIRNFDTMERQQFKGITDFDLDNTWGLFGVFDETANTYDLFKKHYPNARRFEGNHRLNDKILRTVVVPLARDLINKRTSTLLKLL